MDGTADAARFEESLGDKVLRMRLRELVDQDLATILDLLDHTPPPESLALAVSVQEAVNEVLETRAAGAMPMVHKRAVEGLYFYASHLDRLIRAAHSAEPGTDDGGRGKALLDVMKRGAPVLAASGLGAAVDILIAPGAGSLAMAALAPKVALEAGKGALVSGVEFGADAFVGRLLASEKCEATPPDRSRALFELVRRYGAVLLTSAAPGNDTSAAEAAGIALLSTLYELAALSMSHAALAGWEHAAFGLIETVNRCRRTEDGRFDAGVIADHRTALESGLNLFR